MTTHAFVYIGTYTKTMPHVVGKAKGISVSYTHLDVYKRQQ